MTDIVAPVGSEYPYEANTREKITQALGVEDFDRATILEAVARSVIFDPGRLSEAHTEATSLLEDSSVKLRPKEYELLRLIKAGGEMARGDTPDRQHWVIDGRSESSEVEQAAANVIDAILEGSQAGDGW